MIWLENLITVLNDMQSHIPWWIWLLLLFALSFCIGVVAITAGIGGGLIYVPIVGTLFPFHIDYVRGAGLMLALCGSLAAAPRLIRSGMASLRLALPIALFGVSGALIGANVGLGLSGNLIELLLGITVIILAFVMIFSKHSEHPTLKSPDKLALRLGIGGQFLDPASGTVIDWNVKNLKLGCLVFLLIGIIGGLLGLGVGWAHVPALNLLLGAPLKVSVATSAILIAIDGSAAAWIYLKEGAVLPVIAIPSVTGMMLGTRFGAKLLGRINPKIVRSMIIGVLLLAGLRSIYLNFRVFL